jgi:hypothetical protein
MRTNNALEQAVAAVWSIPFPGPDQLLASPAVVALGELCRALYGTGKAQIALHNALRSLGIPCGLPAGHAQLALSSHSAAAGLENAFSRRTAIRRHLCPLDLADEIPQLAFGNARVARFEVAELEELFDAPRLRRLYPDQPLVSQRLAQFHWLVVEEEIQLDRRPEARAVPYLFTTIGRDYGEIEPHLGRFPAAVENALFFLLLAEWEEWSTMPEVDWRGFRVPWIYTFDDDLFTRPAPPPSADSLSLEPAIFQDRYGNEVEDERPIVLPLDGKVPAELALYTDPAWNILEAARARRPCLRHRSPTSLFERSSPTVWMR